jgi:hypothetical protein
LDLRLLGEYLSAFDELFHLRTALFGVPERNGLSLDGSVEASPLFGFVWELSFEKFPPVLCGVSQLGGISNFFTDTVSVVWIGGATLVSS